MHTQKDNNQHIIVYRSKGEKLTDEFLYEEGGFFYICLLMLLTAVVVISYDKFSKRSNRRL